MSAQLPSVSRIRKIPKDFVPPHVFVWGWGADGRLGHGTEYNAMTPLALTFTSKTTKVIQASAGENHTLLLTQDGEILVFGNGESGQLGLGDSRRKQLVPAVLPPISKKGDIDFHINKVVYISCGAYASYALTEGGKILGWGTEVSY